MWGEEKASEEEQKTTTTTKKTTTTTAELWVGQYHAAFTCCFSSWKPPWQLTLMTLRGCSCLATAEVTSHIWSWTICPVAVSPNEGMMGMVRRIMHHSISAGLTCFTLALLLLLTDWQRKWKWTGCLKGLTMHLNGKGNWIQNESQNHAQNASQHHFYCFLKKSESWNPAVAWKVPTMKVAITYVHAEEIK